MYICLLNLLAFPTVFMQNLNCLSSTPQNVSLVTFAVLSWFYNSCAQRLGLFVGWRYSVHTILLYNAALLP